MTPQQTDVASVLAGAWLHFDARTARTPTDAILQAGVAAPRDAVLAAIYTWQECLAHAPHDAPCVAIFATALDALGWSHEAGH